MLPSRQSRPQDFDSATMQDVVGWPHEYNSGADGGLDND